MKTKGHLHPLTQLMRLSLRYFQDLGFEIMESDEIESEWYNFDALNVPADHPSRDVQDTFWLALDNQSPEALAKGSGEVLRTHTTGSELRIIKEQKIKPPFKIVVPGRCYRNERTDMTHEHTFYQIDGIIVDKKINISSLIAILSGWFKYLYGDNIQVRTIPSHFPFVEPGLEMHVKINQKPKTKNQKLNGGWREMLGAGMGHPAVLKNMGLDPEVWQAAMWGPGIDRFAMIKYRIDDIRKFHSQDLRFLKQF